MKRKTFAILLSMAMVVSMMPATTMTVWGDAHVHSYDSYGGCSCGAHGGALGSDHTSWTELTQEDFTWNTSQYKTTFIDENIIEIPQGNYYINSDLTLDAAIRVGGDVNICLNGYFIIDNGQLVNIFDLTAYSKEVTINIFDCNKSTTHYFTYNEEKELFSNYK